MALISLKDVSLAFGGPALLDSVDLHIEQGERVCLIGRNGTGKSSLLKLIHRELDPDSGTITLAPGMKTALLTQDVNLELDGSVYDVTASGLSHAAVLIEYQKCALEISRCSDPSELDRLSRNQHDLETAGARELHQQVRTILSRMGLDETAAFRSLSAGLKRRVYLARALVSEPDILLLDEPTNHLDIDAIIWMERFLIHTVKTIVFVTHDRTFLRQLATRVVELDRGRLLSFPGDYDNYLLRREQFLESEAVCNAEFDKKLKREEIWLRQGIKARRTRNEGRVRALMAMRAEVQRRRSQSGNIRLVRQDAEISGKLVIDAVDITFSYGDLPIIENFSTTILRGDKVGIIGPNGCGKSTLLRILLGELPPESGRVRHGTSLQIAYFDQLRAQLDDGKTLQENVAEDGDMVIVNGKPRHVIGYLQDFLFSPEQARAPISRLSGGERNRLLLAKLFTRPSNVLVLDEPTNDLDTETLELLESMLIDYPGTTLIVSHDRTFLNNVVTSTLVFEGRGHIQEYVGGYDDWLRSRPREEKPSGEPPAKKPKSRNAPAAPRKLSFKEQRELDQLPDVIEGLESRKQGLFATLADPELYKTSPAEIRRLQSELETVERDLEAAYGRWELLENLVSERAKGAKDAG